MSKKKESEAVRKVRLLEYQFRLARLWLGEVGVRVGRELKIDENTGIPYLPCSIQLLSTKGEDVVPFRFPLTGLGRRYLREIRTHLLKGLVCLTIDPEDIKALFIALSTPPFIYKHRHKLRKATGLIRQDPKLKRWLIWRRATAVKLVKRGETKFEKKTYRS